MAINRRKAIALLAAPFVGLGCFSGLLHVVINGFQITDYGKLKPEQVFKKVFSFKDPSLVTIVKITGHEVGQVNQIWMHLRDRRGDFVRDENRFEPIASADLKVSCIKPRPRILSLLLPSFYDILCADELQAGWSDVCSNPSAYRFYSFGSEVSEAEDGILPPGSGTVAVRSTGNLYVQWQG